ncbi:MAG: hypothetical protein ACK2T0_10010, partial [Anaerolineales bacterium]
YYDTPECRRQLESAGIRLTEESSFQGGDGYLFFLHEHGALAVLTRMLEHCLEPAEEGPDPFYVETAYTDARSVAFLAGSTSQHGLTLVPDTGEGTYGSAIIDGKHAVTSEKPATDAHAYRLSFQVDDGFYFAQKRSVVLRVDYFDEGKDPIMLEYDGAPCRDNSGEAGFRQVLLAEREGSNTWRTAELALDEATFASQGSTPDFRLVTEKTALAVHLVRVADATP